MQFVTKLDEKIDLIKEIFSPLIGETFAYYETAEGYFTENSEAFDNDIAKWDNFPDIPVFLCFAKQQVISVCWEKFDDLAIASGRQLSFSLNGSILKWSIHNLSNRKQKLKKVHLASNHMTWDNVKIKIWIHLLLEFDNRKVLEITNNLDENEIRIHTDLPNYETILVVE